MARIRIELPDYFPFTAVIPVRITDLNYGGHVGNDSVLSLIHEARMQFLGHYGYTELSLAGAALIMAEVAIEFKKEIFYGDTVLASVAAGDFSKIGFALYYKLEKKDPETGKITLLATAQTGMICYDYALKKVRPVPEQVIASFSGASASTATPAEKQPPPH